MRYIRAIAAGVTSGLIVFGVIRFCIGSEANHILSLVPFITAATGTTSMLLKK